jgi:hypothetical protein
MYTPGKGTPTQLELRHVPLHPIASRAMALVVGILTKARILGPSVNAQPNKPPFQKWLLLDVVEC